MKITIYAFTARQPDWIDAGVRDFQKRFPRDFSVDIVELRPEPRTNGKTVEQWLQAEAVHFRDVYRRTTPNALLTILDERGRDTTTAQLAAWLKDKSLDSPHLAFLIGSADGLDRELKRQAQHSLRLSSFTLPHGLAKLILVEQLYRAVSLIKNHPYHRE